MFATRLLHRSSRLPTLFAATGLVLTAALTWLTIRLLQQDRALVSERLERRLNNTADLVTASLLGGLAEVDAELHRLARLPNSSLTDAAERLGNRVGDDALIAVLGPHEVKAYPGTRLLYYPVIPATESLNAAVFAAGELGEFRGEDLAGAAAAYEQLARSPDKATRAGALVRLGRVRRKASQPELALKAYETLGTVGDISIEGIPAELIARHARCALLAELDQLPELEQEAHSLWSGLRQGRWPLTHAAYRFHEAHTLGWLRADESPRHDSLSEDDGALVLAGGVEELWETWQRMRRDEVKTEGHAGLWVHQSQVFLVWSGAEDRLVALVARSRYIQTQWLAPLRAIIEGAGVQVALADAKGRPVLGDWNSGADQQAVRMAAQSRLPWALQVTNVDPSSVETELAARRRVVLGGLAAMIAVIMAASYAIVRSVASELAVARLKSDFVSTVSHEFRTPLASLCQLSELLVEGRVPSDQRRMEYYQALRRESERLRRLVESILDFGRMEDGAREFEFESVDVAEIVREVAGEVAGEVRGQGYHVDMHVAEPLPHVRADREALSRAVWNLLDNAMKYSPNHKTIWVAVSCANDQVVIRVRDQGVGIAPTEKDRVFEKFFRASSAKTAGAKGTGLGLAIVRHIVDAHRGELTVESEPGAGSTFTILLPTAPEQA